MIKPDMNSSYSTVFAPLQSSNSASFAITKPITQKQKQEEKEQREKKVSHLGKFIVAAGATVGLGAILVSRLFSKKSGFLKKLTNKLEEKASKMNENQKFGWMQNFYHSAVKITRNIANKSRALFTIATLKDIPFKKAVMKIPVLNSVGESITKFFQKVSIKTADMSYNRTHARFETMLAQMRESAEKMPKQEADKIKKLINAVEQDYLRGFSQTARNARLKKAEKNMNTLYDDVWQSTYGNPKKLYNKETYSEFLAEKHAEKAKMGLNKAINAAKGKVSISDKTKLMETKKLLNDIEMYIDFTDDGSRELLKRLQTHIKKGRILSYREIAKDLDALGKYIKKSDKYKSTNVSDKLLTSISNLTSLLRTNKQGKVQGIMGIFKKNLSDAEFAKLNKSVNKAVKSFDKSTDLEGDKLFDKIRDLKLGSAIHDTIGFIGSLLAVGWYVGKADDKDERISATLKYGIPAIASVIITAICTFGLIASGPSLIIGGASGFLINRLGKSIDDARHDYKEKQQAKKDLGKNIKEKSG